MSDPSPSTALVEFRKQQARRYAGDASAALVGVSPAMARARSQVDVAVGSGANVVVTGRDAAVLAEIAEAIHYRRHATGEASLWRVEVETALPSELGRALGNLLRTDVAGTLVIESIDCLPAEQQLDLLNAMSDQRWTAQLIATRATGSLQTGGLSDELTAAISTLAIEIPPLAERPEDIPPLVDWQLARLNRESSDADVGLADEALDVLMIYAWPGESRELADAVASAHRRARGPRITARDLPKVLHHAVDHAAMATDRPEPIDLDDYLSRVEAALVERALELAAGNKAEAARLLGVSRPRLYRKLEQMGIIEPAPPQPPREVAKQPPVTTDGTAPPDEGIEFLPVEGDE